MQVTKNTLFHTTHNETVTLLPFPTLYICTHPYPAFTNTTHTDSLLIPNMVVQPGGLLDRESKQGEAEQQAQHEGEEETVHEQLPFCHNEGIHGCY